MAVRARVVALGEVFYRRAGVVAVFVSVVVGGLYLASPVEERAGAVFAGSNGRIAYSAGLACPRGPQFLYSVRPDGTDRVELGSYGDHPAWSPNGAQIAFAGSSPSGYSVFVMNADGSDVREVVNRAAFATWSPDGQSLAVAERSPTSDWPNSITRINIDGTDKRPLITGSMHLASPAWSPDGESIAYVAVNESVDPATGELRLINVDGTNNRVLARADETILSFATPSWSADGSRLLATTRFRDEVGLPELLTVFAPNDDHYFFLGASGTHGSWSPDSTRLAYVANSRSVMVADADGSNSSEVACGSSLDWQPISPAPAIDDSWYGMVSEDGTVYTFPLIKHWGHAPLPSGVRAVDFVITDEGTGYYVLDSTGVVYAIGPDTDDHGSLNLASLNPGEFPSAITVTESGDGYWIFTSHGRVVPFGDASDLGGVSNLPLQGEIVDAAAFPPGFYMTGTDGGVFTPPAFIGSPAVPFYGSVPGQLEGVRLNQPIVTIYVDATDHDGYSLAAGDGGMFNFESEFCGSLPGVLPGVTLNRPVVNAVPYGDCYVFFAADGGAFVFGDQPFLGSLGDNPPHEDIVSGDAYAL